MSSTQRRDIDHLSYDVQQFLLHYPSQSTDVQGTLNLKFYSNQTPMRPDNVTISHVHLKWRGQYDILESKHGYIQWLFPIRERSGANYASQPLCPIEIPGLTDLRNVVLRSLDIMLDFYGMRILNRKTFEIARTEEYEGRFLNLQHRAHNYLRLTRIFKCLSELSLERYNVPILLFFLVEQSRGELDNRILTGSMDNYWIHCIRDDDARQFIRDVVKYVRKGGRLSEEEYRGLLKHKQETGSWKAAGADSATVMGQL